MKKAMRTATRIAMEKIKTVTIKTSNERKATKDGKKYRER